MDDQNPRAFGPDPGFLPRWVRDTVAAWLAEELLEHPGDPDAAAVGLKARMEADPRIVHTIGEAFARGVVLEGRPRGGLPPPEPVTPLVAELDRLREELSGGREFPCAAEVLHALREEQEAAE